jgi:hypothetical protein
MGAGASTFTPIHASMTYFPNNKGLVAFANLVGYAFGPVVYGNIGFSIVNPDNVMPTEKDALGHLYFPAEVHSRVPTMLLVWAMMYAAVSIFAIIFVKGVVDVPPPPAAKGRNYNLWKCKTFYKVLFIYFFVIFFAVYFQNVYKTFANDMGVVNDA